MQLSSSPELGLHFFGFLLINDSYKSISISAHKHSHPLLRLWDLFAIFAGGLALFKLTTHHL